MDYFKLPDLGEGLQEAEIVRWHVEAGDRVSQEQILVTVETAKAIVDIPSPRDGTIARLFGTPGDIMHVEDPLVEFVSSDNQPSDAGSVVGKVEVGDTVLTEAPIPVGHTPATGIRATPAVRALAARLKVDLELVSPGGRENTITVEDVRRAERFLNAAGEITPLRGVRRAMANTLSRAHASVVPVTINDDADIQAWADDEDLSIRLIRAIGRACRAEPALNAWYDSRAIGRTLMKNIDLGIAVDTAHGLFVPVLRNIAERGRDDLRRGLDSIKAAVSSRTIPAADLRGYTITLSNFGTYAGRYANPVVVPPSVAILGAGHGRAEVVADNDQVAIHRILPLSLSFDHRAVTGGEAARFMKAVLDDLRLAA